MNVHSTIILFNKVDRTVSVRFHTDLLPANHPLMYPVFGPDGVTVTSCRTDRAVRIPPQRPNDFDLESFLLLYAPMTDLEAMEAAVSGQVEAIDDLIAMYPTVPVYDGPPPPPPPPAPTPAPTLAQRRAELFNRMLVYVQGRLDGAARGLGYDDINSVAKYVMSKNPKFRYEAKWLTDLCSDHWDKCYELLARYQNSNWEDIPIWNDLIAELPSLAYEAPSSYN